MSFSGLLSSLRLMWRSPALSQTLHTLAEASDRVAGGDLSVRLPVEGDDEIGRLSASFNRMAEALRGRVEALEESEAKFHEIGRAHV